MSDFTGEKLGVLCQLLHIVFRLKSQMINQIDHSLRRLRLTFSRVNSCSLDLIAIDRRWLVSCGKLEVELEDESLSMTSRLRDLFTLLVGDRRRHS